MAELGWEDLPSQLYESLTEDEKETVRKDFLSAFPYREGLKWALTGPERDFRNAKALEVMKLRKDIAIQGIDITPEEFEIIRDAAIEAGLDVKKEEDLYHLTRDEADKLAELIDTVVEERK